MLNNLTNFFNLITGRMIKRVPENTDLMVLGTKDTRYTGGYKPTAITVEDFIAATQGVSNKLFVQFKRGVEITNDTAIVKSVSFKIPANTITSDTLLEVLTTAIRIPGGANARIQFVLLHNTTDSVSGASFLAQFLDLTTGVYFTHNTRSVLLDYSAGKIKTFEASNLQGTDFFRTGVPVTISANFTVDNYFILALKNDSLLDTSKVDYAQITSNNLAS